METPDFGIAWEPCNDEDAAQALSRLAGDSPQVFGDSTLVSARSAKLAFYAAHRLIELHVECGHGPERAFVLHGPDDTHWLDGRSDSVHEVNEDEILALTESTVEDYVRYFMYFVRGEAGAFVLIESEDHVALGESGGGSPEGNGGSVAGDASVLETRLLAVRGRATPLTIRETDEHGRWVIECSVAYEGHFFLATLAVASDGIVEMIDDEPIESLEGLSVREYWPLALATSSSDPQGSNGLGDTAASIASFEEKLIAAGLVGGPGQPLDPELPRDRDITEAIVAVLLEDAIRAADSGAGGNRLLRHFNSETGSDKPLDWLARLVTSSAPVIVIESDIPFVEDFVAELVATGKRVSRASAVSGDELRCQVDLSSPVDLHLISFHAYRSLYDPERTAHELAIHDAAVLVGCDRTPSVPEQLRRIADLKLTFPRIDRRRFARIFERVFHAKPARGWDAPGADWTRYLVPADFHMPRRLRLAPGAAVRLLERPGPATPRRRHSGHRPAPPRAARARGGSPDLRGPHRRRPRRAGRQGSLVGGGQGLASCRSSGNRQDDARARRGQGVRHQVHRRQRSDLAVRRPPRRSHPSHA